MDHELDRQLTERFLDQHEAAWRRFTRNLALASVAVLALQFVTVPRYIELTSERPRVEQQIAQTSRDLQVVQRTEQRLEQAQQVVQTGLTELQQKLDDTVDTLRLQMDQMSRQINLLRTTREAPDLPRLPPPGGGPPGIDAGPTLPGGGPPALGGGPITLQAPPLPVQWPIQEPGQPVPTMGADPTAGPPRGPWGWNVQDALTASETELLRRGDPASDEFRAVVRQLVDRLVVQPTFGDLNRQKQRLVDQLAEQRASVLAPLRAQRGDAPPGAPGDAPSDAAAGTSDAGSPWVAAIEAPLLLAHEQLTGIVFQPPKKPDWWRTVRDKEQQIAVLEVATDEMASDVGRQLDTSKLGVAERVRALLESRELAARRKTEIEEELAHVQQQLEATQQMLGLYSQPLPFLALKPSDLAPLYPVVLAALFAYFMARCGALHARTRVLVRLLDAQGLSDEVGRTYFGRYDPVAAIRRFVPLPAALAGPALLLAFLLLGAALIGYSMEWVFSTPAIVQELTAGHRAAYGAAGVALAASFLFAARQLCARPA